MIPREVKKTESNHFIIVDDVMRCTHQFRKNGTYKETHYWNTTIPYIEDFIPDLTNEEMDID